MKYDWIYASWIHDWSWINGCGVNILAIHDSYLHVGKNLKTDDKMVSDSLIPIPKVAEVEGMPIPPSQSWSFAEADPSLTLFDVCNVIRPETHSIIFLAWPGGY